MAVIFNLDDYRIILPTGKDPHELCVVLDLCPVLLARNQKPAWFGYFTPSWKGGQR